MKIPIPTPVLTGSGSKGPSFEVSDSIEPPLRPIPTIKYFLFQDTHQFNLVSPESTFKIEQ